MSRTSVMLVSTPKLTLTLGAGVCAKAKRGMDTATRIVARKGSSIADTTRERNTSRRSHSALQSHRDLRACTTPARAAEHEYRFSLKQRDRDAPLHTAAGT